MTTQDILNFWKAAVPQGWESTCDGIWYDWPDKPVRRIAVCFKITFSNLRQAIDWGPRAKRFIRSHRLQKEEIPTGTNGTRG